MKVTALISGFMVAGMAAGAALPVDADNGLITRDGNPPPHPPPPPPQNPPEK
ncbi:hypothetical protein PVAR5_9045, partial [Paecilomyces variotii No. 5]